MVTVGRNISKRGEIGREAGGRCVQVRAPQQRAGGCAAGSQAVLLSGAAKAEREAAASTQATCLGLGPTQHEQGARGAERRRRGHPCHHALPGELPKQVTGTRLRATFSGNTRRSHNGPPRGGRGNTCVCPLRVQNGSTTISFPHNSFTTSS